MYDNIFCEVWERRVSETKVVNKIHHHSDPENPKIIETVKTKVELDVLLFENIPSGPTTPGKDQDVIFGILPAGSANGLAVDLDLPKTTLYHPM